MLENKVKCFWKRLYESGDSTTFHEAEKEKSGVRDCIKCDGYKTRKQCTFYTEYITVPKVSDYV